MKAYDLESARELIDSTPGLKSAAYGIMEDWNATVAVIWENGEYIDNEDVEIFADDVVYINGIKGSEYGTPAVRLYFENGTSKGVPMFKEVSE